MSIGPSLSIDDSMFKSSLSFGPLLKSIKKTIAESNPGSQRLYGDLIAEIESHPELLKPIDDYDSLKSHAELLEMLLATIFPPTSNEKLYAISFPFKFKTIYTSHSFRQLFLRPGNDEINIPAQLTQQLNAEKMLFAYYLILEKYQNYNAPETSRTVYPYADPVTGLLKYLELNIDPRFVEVRTIDGQDPQIPENIVCSRTNKLVSLEELNKALPLSKFIFEGLVIIRLRDVTEEAVISEIKNTLLHINAFTDSGVYEKLQSNIQSLLGMKDVRISITPFFKVNGHYIYSELHNNNSLLFRQFTASSEKENVSDSCQQFFYRLDDPVVFETLDNKALAEIESLKHYYDIGGRSLIICPLKHNKELIGLLEIISPEPGKLKNSHIRKIEAAIPLFTLALEKSAESLNTQIDRVVKEQFTAVQPAVEWKFTEVALNYIVAKQKSEDVKIDRIAFDDVYPLYGSIDIRNSAVERSHSMQLDLLQQLNLARDIVRKAQLEIHFPLLQEIEFKIEKYILSASDILMSDEEVLIQDFLQSQVVSILNHLSSTLPSIKENIDTYFKTVDPQVGIIYHHRKAYEESISKINDALSKFIDKEQASAQQVFPHYFERYVTDGVDFNIYIGQSIARKKKFDEIYLRNMKMWQLTLLAKAARLTNDLGKTLSHPLKTTQLILAHNNPISISFRTTERKFDVDGAYNIRYEIIKKRIDKVRIKETNERLTQPGKIAIVYSQPKEFAEYMEYIEFMQNRKLIKQGVEQFELEELQGVLGLKALRVEVDIDEATKTESKIELSTLTSQELLRH